MSILLPATAIMLDQFRVGCSTPLSRIDYWHYSHLTLLIWFSLVTLTGTPCFRGYGRRNGERRRKSVRGCIVSPDLSVLNLVIVKKGDNDLPGLTDVEKPRMRGPKRASKIRKLFNLSKDDDVRKYVNTYRRTFTTKAGKLLLCECYILLCPASKKGLMGRWELLMKNSLHV